MRTALFPMHRYECNGSRVGLVKVEDLRVRSHRRERVESASIHYKV